MKRPDTLGDGGNQFVYGSELPDGYLSVPGAVTVTGGGQADAQWLVDNNKIDMKVEDSAIGGAFTHGWAVAGGRILLDTSYTGENGMQAYSYGWVFKGLPTLNSGFGNHEVNLYVDGGKSETAHIQTFFNATAFNSWAQVYNPQPPNWLVFYSGVYARDLFPHYTPTGSSYTDPNTGFIFLGNDAHGPWTVRVMNLVSDGSGHRRVHFTGLWNLGGIHHYIYTYEHECGHVYSESHGIEVDGIFANDGDHDGLDGGWETRNNFDPNNNDTSGGYSDIPIDHPDYGKGDREAVADIQATGYLTGQKALWHQDWANDGLQWGNWGPHDLEVTDVSHIATPYHPWNRYSVE